MILSYPIYKSLSLSLNFNKSFKLFLLKLDWKCRDNYMKHCEFNIGKKVGQNECAVGDTAYYGSTSHNTVIAVGKKF